MNGRAESKVKKKGARHEEKLKKMLFIHRCIVTGKVLNAAVCNVVQSKIESTRCSSLSFSRHFLGQSNIRDIQARTFNAVSTMLHIYIENIYCSSFEKVAD